MAQRYNEKLLSFTHVQFKLCSCGLDHHGGRATTLWLASGGRGIVGGRRQRCRKRLRVCFILVRSNRTH